MFPDEPMIDPEMPIEEEKSGIPTWQWIVIALAALAVIIAAIIVIKKRRSKKKDESTDFNWEEELDPANDAKNSQEVGKK